MNTALVLTRTTYNAQDEHPDTVLSTETVASFEEPDAHKKLAAYLAHHVNPVALYVAWDGNIYPQYKVHRVDLK
jgi:hypothetical protein